MQFFKDPQGQLFAFEDDVSVSGAPGALVFTAPHGARLDVPGALAPAPAPTAPPPMDAARAQHRGDAARALRATEAVALRCFMAGQPFPAAWQTYAQELRAIAATPSGTPAPLPAAPVLPAGL